MTEFRRAQRIAAIEVSQITKIAEAVRARRALGEDVIPLSTGEPDFDTPEHIKEAAIRALRDNDTHYPQMAGTPALKGAIQRKLARENGLEFAANQIIVSTGAKQVLFNALMATLDPGDEVVIPTPYWATYADMVGMAGAVPVTLFCEQSDGFKLTPEQLAAAITPRTRWLLLNSPCNPTGAAYTRDELAALAAVCDRWPSLRVVADEIYEHLVYDGFEFASFAAVAARDFPSLFERTLIVNGVSKAYAMTGWRIGYGAGAPALIAAMTVVQAQVTSGANSIAQAASVAALDGPQDCVAAFRASFEARRDLVVRELSQCEGLMCLNPVGAFYVLPDCSATFGRRTSGGAVIGDETDFCHYVLDEVGVGVTPGSAFGAPGHFRLSYAAATGLLQDATRRIATACARLT